VGVGGPAAIMFAFKIDFNPMAGVKPYRLTGFPLTTLMKDPQQLFTGGKLSLNSYLAPRYELPYCEGKIYERRADRACFTIANTVVNGGNYDGLYTNR
jgi:hypothetical protein